MVRLDRGRFKLRHWSDGIIVGLVVALLSLSMWSVLSIVPEPVVSEVEQPPTCIYLNEGE